MTNKIISNDKEFNIHRWLNEDFLEKALRTGEGSSSSSVISSEIKSATAAGDNYASNMYRAVVQIIKGGQKEERSVIIKAAKHATNGKMDKFLEDSTFFEREIDTFALIHPELYRLLNEVSFTTYRPFAAKYLYSQEAKVIVFEDLKKRGFTLAASNFGLDLNHCLLVISTIARYHAASVVLHDENPEIFKPFLEKVIPYEQQKLFAPMFKNNVINVKKILSTWPGYDGRYSDKFIELTEEGIKKWFDATQREESSFNVLTHGDLWTNNIMFRYSGNSDEAVDVRFVDFQLSYWTTPALDLLYFLNSSASPAVLKEFDKVIEKYHSELCETLNQLRYEKPQPALEELKADIDKRNVIALITAFSIRAIALVDRNKVPDFNKVLTLEESMNFSETYQSSLKEIIPIYEKRRWMQI